MKKFYIIYKCFSKRGRVYERVEQWYGCIPCKDDEAAKQECRSIWAQHQGKEFRKEIMLLDANKNTLFEHRNCDKGELPVIM